MSVTFEISAPLQRFTDGQSRVVVEGPDVQTVLDSLWQQFPELKQRVLTPNGDLFPYLLLFQNGEKLPRKNLTSIPLADGDRLELVGLAEGG